MILIESGIKPYSIQFSGVDYTLELKILIYTSFYFKICYKKESKYLIS